LIPQRDADEVRRITDFEPYLELILRQGSAQLSVPFREMSPR
jgi:hypothetical protein